MKQNKLFGLALGALLLIPAVAMWATGGKEGAETEKVMTISWIGLEGGDIQDGNWVQRRIEEIFNVELVNKVGVVGNREFRNLMLSSGEMPDCGFMRLDAIRTYLDGHTRSIPKQYIEKYMPNFAKMLDENPPGWLLHLAPDKEEEYIALTGISVNLEMLLVNSYQRLDWMENTGVPVGNKELIQIDDEGRYFFSKDSFSIDELDEMFRAFTYDDPDGNGKDDTHGLGGSNNFTDSWGPLTGAYGFGNGRNVYENGKLYDWLIYPGYREFMKKLAEWNAEGYLDPEFTTDNVEKKWEKLKAGYHGWFMSTFNYTDPTRTVFLNRPPMSITRSNPNAKLLMTPPVIGPTGKRGARQWSNVGSLAYIFSIRHDVSDEKLIKILQIVDYLNFDKEARVWSRWGEIGVHSDWSGEPYKSVPQLREGIADGTDTGFYYYNHAIYDDQFCENYMFGPWPKKIISEFVATPEGRALNIRHYKFDYFNETNLSDLNRKYGADLGTITDEFFYRGVTGEIDIDAEWDDYVQRWLKVGGQEILDELMKAPIVEELRKGKIVY